MPKIISSSNGRQYTITLPKKIIESIGWKKGDVITIDLKGRDKLMLVKI